MNNWTFSENYYWKNDFPQCGGPYQSPINIDTEIQYQLAKTIAEKNVKKKK